MGGHDTPLEYVRASLSTFPTNSNYVRHAAGSDVIQFSPRKPEQSADGGRASDHSASTNDTRYLTLIRKSV